MSMDTPNSPEAFERATGVVEGTRQCDHCGNAYRATAAIGDAYRCPSCKSSMTHGVIAAAVVTPSHPPLARR